MVSNETQTFIYVVEFSAVMRTQYLFPPDAISAKCIQHFENAKCLAMKLF